MPDTRALADALTKATTSQFGVTKFADNGEATTGEAVQSDDARLGNSRSPTGAAGGVLSGTYPDPGFAEDMATQVELAAVAAATDAAQTDATAVIADLATHEALVADASTLAHVTLDQIQDMIDLGTGVSPGSDLDHPHITDYIELEVQAGTPTTPASGDIRLFAGLDHLTYIDELDVILELMHVGETIDAGLIDGGVIAPEHLGLGVDDDYVLRSDSTWGQVTNEMMAIEPASVTDFDAHVSLLAAGPSDDGHMTGEDKDKLDGIEDGATANDTDANLKARANHTGTQVSATISDFNASADARVAVHAAVLVDDTSVDGHMQWEDKDKLDGIVAGATANSPDATLLARANHTGTQLAATISDFATAADAAADALVDAHAAIMADDTSVDGHMQWEDKAKLDGIEDDATANSPDATLLARANHTGTQLAATVSDFATAVDAILAVHAAIMAAGPATAGHMSGADKAKLDLLTLAAAIALTGGGTIALGGFTFTVPATGTAALLQALNVFTNDLTILKSGPTLLIQSTDTVAVDVLLNSPASTAKNIRFQTDGVNRWVMQTNVANTQWAMFAYNDSGVLVGTAFSLNRTTLAAVFGGVISATNINAAFVGGSGTAALLGTTNIFTVNQTVRKATGDVAFSIDTLLANDSDLFFQAASVNRWRLQRNSSGNFVITAYDAAGASVGAVITLNNATRLATFGAALTAVGVISGSNINAAFVGGAGTAALIAAANVFSAKQIIRDHVTATSLEIDPDWTNTSGTLRGIYVNPTLQAATDSAAAFRGINVQIETLGTVAYTGAAIAMILLTSYQGTGLANNQWGSSHSVQNTNGGSITNAIAVDAAIAQTTVAGIIATATGVQAKVSNSIAGSAITNAYLFRALVPVNTASTIAALYAYYAANMGAAGITASYGLYIDAQSGSTTPYAIYSAGGQSYHAGNFGIGVAVPTVKLDVAGTVKATGYVGIPRVLGGWVSEAAPAVGDHFGKVTLIVDVDSTFVDVIGYATDAAVGTAATFDIEYKRGAGAWTTLFSVLPTFAVGANSVTAGTKSVTSLNAGDLIRLNWDAVNALAGVTVAMKLTTR
jgi:hypothetical protein